MSAAHDRPLPDSAGAECAASGGVGITPSLIEALLRAARSEHPGVAVEAAELGAHLAALSSRRADSEAGIDAAQLFLYAADLYLACGCALGRPAAVARFEALCLPTARAAIVRIDDRSRFVADVLQDLRARLLCRDSDGKPPRIARYGGRGPLLGWVRTAAVRLALNRLREQRRIKEVTADDELGATAAAGGDPELGFIRNHYREHFKAAFAAALGTLSSRERTVLRLHLLDRLTEEQIGALYRAHRVTVARWLAKARRQLLGETQRLLAERIGLPAGQLESMTGLIPSRLELSLSRLLRSQ